MSDVTNGTLRVRELAPGGVHPDWDEFASRHATAFHTTAWMESVRATFGWRTFLLCAEGSDGIEGILPLGHVHSRLFGNALISIPYAVYGGIAAVTDRARAELDRRAVELAQELRVDYLELRNVEPSASGRPIKDIYVTFRKSISPEPEENLAAIPRKQRAVVRKGIKAGLTWTCDSDIDRFFDLYSRSVRNLGTPVLPKKWFAGLAREFSDKCEVLTVLDRGQPVSSVLSLYFGNEVLPYYGGGDTQARKVRANDYMYYAQMSRAGERGATLFDYGRSKVGTGSYSFKKNWGFEPQPLPYEYHLVKAPEMPDLNPLNPKYQLMVKTWQKLPLALTRIVGPMVARNLA